MLRLASERDELTIVADQVGGPTPAWAIAAAAMRFADDIAERSGVYHFQGAPQTSWAEFAEAIFTAAQSPTKVVKNPHQCLQN